MHVGSDECLKIHTVEFSLPKLDALVLPLGSVRGAA